MEKNEFPDFCKRVVGKKGWFPNGKTSVTLVKYDLPSGVGWCEIVRPFKNDEPAEGENAKTPETFRLNRSDVNSGIRGCRDQGKLFNTGELKRAGIRSWATSPLYALLELFFNQVGFSR